MVKPVKRQKKKSKKLCRSQQLVARMRGKGSKRMTTDEIMALTRN
jgi:hypothetical protein